MNKALNDFTGTVRRAVDDYDMIQEGDRVAVGVSGGKDSLVLLAALSHLRGFYPRPFELEAITVELGFEGMDFTPVAALCEELGVPYTRLKTDRKEIVFDVRQEDNPCSRCAKETPLAIAEAFEDYIQMPDEEGTLPEDALSEGDDHLLFDHGAVLLDLAAVAWEQFALALPPTPLCDPGCKGLCPKCGQDLNAGPCGCARDEGDPRLAKLRGLKLKKS